MLDAADDRGVIPYQIRDLEFRPRNRVIDVSGVGHRDEEAEELPLGSDAAISVRQINPQLRLAAAFLALADRQRARGLRPE